MTTIEFSDAFDTLFNSYGIQSRFGDSPIAGIDEYEKSLFLTQAQEQIVRELYSGRNSKGVSFEVTEELRADLKNLIRTAICTKSTQSCTGISVYSKFFVIPSDVMFITYETVTLEDNDSGCKNGSVIPVIPVTQDMFYKTMQNPFRRASERRALRLDNGLDIAEIVTKYNIKNYTIRYITRPTPIVLEDLSDVSIDGIKTITECKLNPAIHMDILERAVMLAAASRNMTGKTNV